MLIKPVFPQLFIVIISINTSQCWCCVIFQPWQTGHVGFVISDKKSRVARAEKLDKSFFEVIICVSLT